VKIPGKLLAKQARRRNRLCLRELTRENRLSQDGPSIFDLSPSENDWQKQELARRKANLLTNPASGLSWEEVKQRVRGRYGR